MLRYKRIYACVYWGGPQGAEVENNALEEFTGNTEIELNGTRCHVQSMKTPICFQVETIRVDERETFRMLYLC